MMMKHHSLYVGGWLTFVMGIMIVCIISIGQPLSLLAYSDLPSFPTPPTGLPGFPTPPTGLPTFPPVPSPTIMPAEISKVKPPEGARIQLRVQPATEKVWERWFWQDVVTIVQWQDNGGWHNVEGWRGTLDTLEGIEGVKTWWLDSSHFETGPFRWLVMDREENIVLGESDVFCLPGRHGEITVIEIVLEF